MRDSKRRFQRVFDGLLQDTDTKETRKRVDEADGSARQNQNNSPLLRLPAELRNKIYTYVLGGNTYRFQPCDFFPQKHKLGILYVCRQTNAEARLLPYTLNSFSFGNARCRDDESLLFVYERTTAQKLAVESLEFRVVILVLNVRKLEILQTLEFFRVDLIQTFTNVKHINVRIHVCEKMAWADTVELVEAVHSIQDSYRNMKADAEFSFERVHDTSTNYRAALAL